MLAETLDRLPSVEGRTIEVRFAPELSAHAGKLLSRGGKGRAVHAGSEIRKRLMVLDSDLLRERQELVRVTGEVFDAYTGEPIQNFRVGVIHRRSGSFPESPERRIDAADGRFELEDKQSHLASMSGNYFDMGRCAVVQHKGITILLTTNKTPPFDLGQWRSQGIEPTKLSIIGVKAAVAHRRAYDPIAARMLWVNTPGPCSSDLKSLPFQNVKRPVYPLDPMG